MILQHAFHNHEIVKQYIQYQHEYTENIGLSNFGHNLVRLDVNKGKRPELYLKPYPQHIHHGLIKYFDFMISTSGLILL